MIVFMNIRGVLIRLCSRYLSRPHPLFEIAVAKILNTTLVSLNYFRTFGYWGHRALHQAAYFRVRVLVSGTD
jgi:hypothetical protein